MVSTVTSRPNHYEVLGLKPDASSTEIAQAFARELSLLTPRPFGSLADVTVAYETLRDPAKRKAYDTSIGLGVEPLRPPPKAPADWKPFLARAHVKPPELPPARKPEPARPVTERVEARPAPSATAMMRQPLRPEARVAEPAPRPEPEAVLPPAAVESPVPEPEAAGHRALHFFEAERGHDAEKDPRDWRLPALIGGALALAVGIGAWTGWSAGNGSEQPQQPAQSAKLKVAPPKVVPAADEVPVAAMPDMAEPSPGLRTRTPVAAQRSARPRPPLEIALPQESPAEAAPVQLAETATEQTVTDSPQAAPTTVDLPLPKSVVARTLGRIGYSCGQVASATAVGGGVYNVTCTSGDTYRAAPVGGRYHFRRLRSR